jgi:triphosphoribosyl-dephospho-CoA synthase
MVPLRVREIALCGQLACLLEVSALKPGNVHRFRDFQDTKFEHFLAGSVALGEPLRKASARGYLAAKGRRSLEEIRLGSLIRESVSRSAEWHRGRNTHLGIAMLLLPLAAAAGHARGSWLRRCSGHPYSGRRMPQFLEEEGIRSSFEEVVRATTYRDTLDLYAALRSLRPSWLGRAENLDVRNAGVDRRIREEELDLYQVMEITRGDSIAWEWTHRMAISFEIGFPAILRSFQETGDIGQAALTGYFEILSRVPDSLIARKNGREMAEQVTEEARRILEDGLDPTRVTAFDERLRDPENRFNPGTTADLVATSLMIALLQGLRP